MTLVAAPASSSSPLSSPYITATNSVLIATRSESFKFYEPPKWTYSSCVEFAKWLTGNTGEGKSYGIAGEIKPNLDRPEVGAWALLKEGSQGHVAVIVSISSSSFTTAEANWRPGIRSSRSLQFTDPKIRGYFRP